MPLSLSTGIRMSKYDSVIQVMDVLTQVWCEESWFGYRSKKMKNLQSARKQPSLSLDSIQSDSVGLLKTGVFSFVLHIVLISFLIFSLKTGTTKSRPTCLSSNHSALIVSEQFGIPFPSKHCQLHSPFLKSLKSRKKKISLKKKY